MYCTVTFVALVADRVRPHWQAPNNMGRRSKSEIGSVKEASTLLFYCVCSVLEIHDPDEFAHVLSTGGNSVTGHPGLLNQVPGKNMPRHSDSNAG